MISYERFSNKARCFIKPIAAEWVPKAEGDFAILERECRARKNPSYDGACFHAQQCAEKYLKARLCEADISFGKTHDLAAVLDCVLGVEAGCFQLDDGSMQSAVTKSSGVG